MSFQSEKYYQKIVKQQVAQYNSLTSEDEKEIYLRNIISRTYYSCYLHCRDTLLSNGVLEEEDLNNDSSHAKVINELPYGLKSQLKQLKNFRIKADYINDSLFLPLRGKPGRGYISFASPQHFEQILETILSYQCSP